MIRLIEEGYAWLKANINYLLTSSWEKTKDIFIQEKSYKVKQNSDNNR